MVTMPWTDRCSSLVDNQDTNVLLLGDMHTLDKVVKMYKIVRGKNSREFGQVEWMMSLNWSSLINALLVTLLGWLGAEALPVLAEHQVLSGGALGVVSMLIPVILNYLRDNRDIAVEKEVKATPKKGDQK
jgi:hypothetical protein